MEFKFLTSENIEKFILYITLGAFFGLVSLLLVIIAKLIIESKFQRSSLRVSRGLPAGLVVPWRRRTRFRGSGDEPEIGRAHDTSQPSFPATISAEELPSRLSAPDNGSPVFVHVESPRESPVLARNHWNNDSNGEEFVDGRSSSILRASSLPRQHAHPERSLLLPRERETALNGNAAVSEGQLVREVSEEFVQPRVTFRSTSALPHRHHYPPEVEGDAPSGATPLLVHTFSNPFRNDESLVKRKSSVRVKPALL